MARNTLAAVAALVAIGLVSGMAGAQQTNHEMQFYPLGERLPKGLTDFQAFGLFRSVEGGKVRLEGWAMADRSNPNESSFDMASVHLDGKKLAFTTRPWKGRTFAFSGVFLRRGDFTPYLNKRVPVLSGTVRKFRGGKKVAEAIMRFRCGAGG
jgi:hypothetical protein